MSSDRHRQDALTLFCLPYAGGSSAIYREWSARLPTWLQLVPLHMPGRGVRHGMPPIHRWPDLLDLLSEDMRVYLDRPFALFGHSMGALIAFELAHAARLRYGRAPVWLGVAACTAPSRRTIEPGWMACDEHVLIKELRALGNMSDELLENREFMEVVLPFLRADFTLCGEHVRSSHERLDCPVLALGGADDAVTTDDAHNIPAWAEETTGAFRVEYLRAGHFFIDTHRDAVIELVANDIAKHVVSPTSSRECLPHACA